MRTDERNRLDRAKEEVQPSLDLLFELPALIPKIGIMPSGLLKQGTAIALRLVGFPSYRTLLLKSV
jgi:hypothetical protein